MSEYFPPDDEDLIFFRKAMQNVRKKKETLVLKNSQKNSYYSNKSFKSITDYLSENSGSTFLVFDPSEQTLNANDRLSFIRQGLQPKIIKKLFRGEITCSACLDLHGMSVEQARKVVVNFLQTSQKKAIRCVLIVHGKGYSSQTGPKLKNHLNYWLEQIPWVLAFCSAQDRHGGTGALYILLSRKQR